MAKQKFHITPDSGRVCTTIGKTQLKALKIIGIEFEEDEKTLLETAINLLITKYHSLTKEQIEKNGKDALFL